MIFGGFGPRQWNGRYPLQRLGNRRSPLVRWVWGKDNNFCSIPMIGCHLMTPDELKSIPFAKENFYHREDGIQPMILWFQLFLRWGQPLRFRSTPRGDWWGPSSSSTVIRRRRKRFCGKKPIPWESAIIAWEFSLYCLCRKIGGAPRSQKSRDTWKLSKRWCENGGKKKSVKNKQKSHAKCQQCLGV